MNTIDETTAYTGRHEADDDDDTYTACPTETCTGYCMCVH